MSSSTPPDDVGAAQLDLVGRQMPLKDIAYERLRDAIVSLALPPGTQLREATLSKQLGISKTPLREAFVRLEREALVEVQPYRGATVRGYDEEDIVEIFELRALLEGHAAAIAAEVEDEAWRDQLRTNIGQSQDHIISGPSDGVAGLLEAFDRLLYTQINNRRMAELWDQIRSHVERIGRLTVRIPGRLERSVEQHSQIADAILAGSGRSAELLMRSHIQSVMRAQVTASS